ncbi:MAG: SPOR domain-containing protein [Desulfovibrio sp.]|nr:SPOR domain-containing protein [Desulfovibrio sp.]
MPRLVKRPPQRGGGGPEKSAAPRFALRLSGLTLAMTCVMLTAIVGWAFFMGFMVGKGAQPGDEVARMARMAGLGDAPTAEDGEAKDQKKAEADAKPPAPEEEIAPPAQAVTPASPTAAGANPQAPAAAGANPEQPAADAPHPFARPSGAGMAAWGGAAQAPPQAGQPKEERKPAPAQAAGPRFDFVYQAAAFKKKSEADALCARLGAKGLRTRQQKSGAVILVQILLRGTSEDAAALENTLRELRLGRPLAVSKTPVARQPKPAEARTGASAGKRGSAQASSAAPAPKNGRKDTRNASRKDRKDAAKKR